MTKRFILNADNLGLSKAFNKGILESYQEGFLKSTSIVANGEAFDEAINFIIPKCSDLGIGIHLNISEGKSLCTDLEFLTNSEQVFNNSFWDILIKSYSSKDNSFFEEIEREFRRQIEKVLSKKQMITHIDSHKHIHSIPPIFEIVCRLAKEYGIKQVRTHFEKFYIIPDLHKHFSKTYFKNLIKLSYLNIFSLINEATTHKWGLKTNDYIIGIGYNSIMDALAISYGISAVDRDNITVEVILKPCRYEEGFVDSNFSEYLISKNKKFKEKIEKLGFEITNYAEKEN